LFDIDLASQRHEIKMVFENTSRFEVETWIRLHSRAFVTAFPNRRVNNLYFDTGSFDSYNDHISGAHERRKLRFRWYGNDLQRGLGQIEIKHKTDMVGWKDTCPIPSPIELDRFSWSEIRETMCQHTRGAFSELIATSQPMLINSYERQYYITADGMIRLTLDYDIRGYDQTLSINPNFIFPLPARDLVIIEFKAPPSQIKDLANVMAEFPLPVEAFSKYVELTTRIFDS